MKNPSNKSFWEKLKHPFEGNFWQEIAAFALVVGSILEKVKALWMPENSEITTLASTLWTGIAIIVVLVLVFLLCKKLLHSSAFQDLTKALGSARDNIDAPTENRLTLPAHEQLTRLLMRYLGRSDQNVLSRWIYWGALLLISFSWALNLVEIEKNQSPQSMLLALWASTIVLPLLGGYSPQQEEKTILPRLKTRSQCLALHLEKVFGLYIASFLAVVGLTLFALFLFYLGWWSWLPNALKIVGWMLAQWLIFTFSFLGAVIAVEYCKRRIKRRPPNQLRFGFGMLGLALAFPLVLYPFFGLMVLLTKPTWQNPMLGLPIIGILLVFLSRQLTQAD